MTNRRHVRMWALLGLLAAPGLASAQGVNVRDVRLGVGFARHITGDASSGYSFGDASNTPSGVAFDVDFTIREGRRARLGAVATLVIHPSGLQEVDLSVGVRWTWLYRQRLAPFFHATVGAVNFWRTGVGGGVQLKLNDRFEIKYQFDLSLLVAEDSEEFFGHLVAFVFRVPIPKR